MFWYRYAVKGTAGALLLLAVAGSGFSESKLTLNIDQAKDSITGEMYGVLMERLGRCVNGGIWVGTKSTIPNTNGMRTDIIEGFKECGVGSIVYPGGCAANEWDWSTNKNPNDDLGVDHYMKLCQLVGSVPYLVGKPKGTDAASNFAWVSYINNNTAHPDWTLSRFKVGNEVWGCGGKQDVNAYITNYNTNYEKLKNPVNDKKLFIIAGTDLIGNNGWLEKMLQTIPEKIDGVEIHDYLYFPKEVPCVNFNDNQYWDIVNRAGEGQMAPRIREIKKIMDKYDPQKRIKIMEDEWGDWFLPVDAASDGWMQQITVLDALSTGITLHVLMQNADRILAASLAQAINVIHSLFLTKRGDGTLVKTPAFYVFKMFIPHHTNNAKYVPGTFTGESITGGGKTLSAVSACASTNSLHEVNVSFTNVDLTTARDITVTINGGEDAYSVSKASVVTGPARNSYNDFGQPEKVNIQPLPESSYRVTGKTLTVTLPTKSIALITLKPDKVSVGTFRTTPSSTAFSVAATRNGAVCITASRSFTTPVTISLLRVDGRTTVERISTDFSTGQRVVLGDHLASNGAYILKIAGAGMNYSKQLALVK